MTQRMPIGNLPRAPPPRAPSSSTACAFEKGDFVWTIDPFNMQCVGLFRIESTEFSATNNSTKWILSLNDKGVWLEHPVRSLFNSPTSRPTQEPIQVKTSFVNARRQRVFINEIFVDKGTAMPIRVNTIDKHTLLQQVNSLIVDGKITILCHIQTCQKRATVSASIAGVANLENKEELLKDFEHLFENMTLSDVTFNIRGQTFPAHKVILAARSPVFAAMFQHPTKENLTGIVDVPDIEVNVFKELLCYIYTGQVSSEWMDEAAIGLLAAADKYLMGKLKIACEDHLAKKMSPEICAKLLLLESTNPAYHCLREKAVDFIRRFPAQVMATGSWKKANEEKPEWIVNIKAMLFDLFFSL